MFLIGILTGVIITSFLFWYNYSDSYYVALKHDYNIENIGTLQAGTKLRFDGAMSEGFTRYVLYVNVDGGIEVEPAEDERSYLKIPYWLSPIDTLQIDDK